MSRGNNPFWRGGGGKSKSKPLFSIPQGNSSINDDNLARTTGVLDVSFTTDLEPGSFVGWKLYFPEKCKILEQTANMFLILKYVFSIQRVSRY